MFDSRGSGELIHLEFHVSPALSGSLREVVVELRYDGAQEPAVRLPLPEFVGVPHPWINGRWQSYNGTLAAGLQYPWYVNTPRFYFPEDTFHFNLPDSFRQRAADRPGEPFREHAVHGLCTRLGYAAFRRGSWKMRTPLCGAGRVPGDASAPIRSRCSACPARGTW